MQDAVAAVRSRKRRQPTPQCIELPSAVCRALEGLGTLAFPQAQAVPSDIIHETSRPQLPNGTPPFACDANSTSRHPTARRTPAQASNIPSCRGPGDEGGESTAQHGMHFIFAASGSPISSTPHEQHPPTPSQCLRSGTAA
ncbi:hypothetical protein SVAN01_01048 [Stagonosporopsis vannaccii]|nr:hypothetical protein SVAN01_01048 [Stagonosporopsis vannaccii]